MTHRRRSLPLVLALGSIVGFACGGDGDSDDDDDTGGSGAETSTGGSDDATSTLSDGDTSSGGSPTSVDSGTSSDGSEESSGGLTGTSDSSTGAPACEGMSFFATSAGTGELGGNLGGLEGADAICQAFAEAVGQGGCTWHAYLSTTEEDARDRIGAGPWQNANGDVIAADVESLHADGVSNDDPQHVVDENGVEVANVEHDILTGSQEDGTLLEGATCADWTDDTDAEIARVGHSDTLNQQVSPSWNSAHDTPGCSAADLESIGGSGRLYCFAIH